jgi:uridine kinase
MTTVRPMHLQFVEPSKRYADIIIPEGGYNEVGIDLIIEKIKVILGRTSRQQVNLPLTDQAGEEGSVN